MFPVKFATVFRRFTRNSSGNVAIILALSSIPLVFAVGAGVDYTLAVERETQLNAIADAASLAAVTPSMMTQTDSASILAAQNAFNAQATAIPDITYNPANLKVTVADTITTRTVTVTYTAISPNLFANVLGMPTIPIGGTSQSSAQNPPNINFYLLLDDSPSMAIAASQSGITTMVNNTSSQGGCAFACHESHPSSDGLGNPSGEDNYALARNLGVTLRIDLLQQATQDLMTTAAATALTDNAKYDMAIYTFDTGFNTIQTLTSNLTAAGTAASAIQVEEVYSNNWLTSSNQNNDTNTNYDNAMTKINSTMPNPGNGTNAAGDTPQEVLFFVTDGVEDENVSGNRQQSLMSNSWCTTIKNRGIRIAVLYTTYYPLPTNTWYNTYISPFQASIAANMQACASPGLYDEVATGGDVSAALIALFNTAVATAHLTK
jgi:Flp pilus assembly protein TadG